MKFFTSTLDISHRTQTQMISRLGRELSVSAYRSDTLVITCREMLQRKMFGSKRRQYLHSDDGAIKIGLLVVTDNKLSSVGINPG